MPANHGPRVAAAAQSLDATTEAFVAFLSKLPARTRTARLPGGWTPAEHAAHVALTNGVFAGVLSGGPTGTGPIPPFLGTSDFSDGAWSFDAPPPATAPPILLPPNDVAFDEAIDRLRHSVAGLGPAIVALDPALAVYCVRLPWATVSVYQMSEWAAGHTMRHLSQISRELQLAAMRPVRD